MTRPQQPPAHPLRCETCENRYCGVSKCPYDDERSYYALKDFIQMPHGIWKFTAIVGCASHTSAASDQRIEQVIKELETKEAKRPAGLTIDDYKEAIALLQAGRK